MNEMVRTYQTCPICAGSGQQTNKDWAEYLSACHHSNLGQCVTSSVQHKTFFTGRGYSEIPNVLEVCTCCNGQGSVRGNIPVIDLYELPHSAASLLNVGKYSIKTGVNKNV